MNVKNDRLSQLLEDALFCLKLTEENQKIAGQYLEFGQRSATAMKST